MQKAGVPIAIRTPVNGLTQNASGIWHVKTPRGIIRAGHVIIATNGYTGDVTPQFKRRVVPVGSYIIATEELPPDLALSLSRRNRSFADTRRVLTYYRPSPDGKRMIFGGRAKFGFTDPTETAPMLHRFMTDRFPQLKGVKITHAWTGNVAFTMDELPHMGKLDGLHFALGCNGSGIAMMSYLGRETARKIAGKSNRQIAFDQPEFPTHPLYHGKPGFCRLLAHGSVLPTGWTAASIDFDAFTREPVTVNAESLFTATTLFTALFHVSNLMAFLAFLLRDQLQLRLMMAVSLFLQGLYYYAIPGGPFFDPLFWKVVSFARQHGDDRSGVWRRWISAFHRHAPALRKNQRSHARAVSQTGQAVKARHRCNNTPADGRPKPDGVPLSAERARHASRKPMQLTPSAVCFWARSHSSTAHQHRRQCSC